MFKGETPIWNSLISLYLQPTTKLYQTEYRSWQFSLSREHCWLFGTIPAIIIDTIILKNSFFCVIFTKLILVFNFDMYWRNFWTLSQNQLRFCYILKIWLCSITYSIRPEEWRVKEELVSDIWIRCFKLNGCWNLIFLVLDLP